MKIVTVVGARPQFVKASVISDAIRKSSLIEEVIVHTGQHFDKNMSDVFFEVLNIPNAKYNLNIGGGTHGQNTGKMIEKIEEILFKEKPDAVLVYGDTDSTLAAAIATSKLHIPLAHVEAGLRSFNRKMPEEVNRVLTDHISHWLFTPTKNACELLKNEGIVKGVEYVGDVMYDLVKKLKEGEFLPEIEEENFILSTLHRAENVDHHDKLQDILKAFEILGDKVILPLHPRTKKRIEEFDLTIPGNIKITEPLSYFELLGYLKKSKCVMTDSGGLQKEAYFMGKPCVTLREETEWVELIKHEVNVLAGSDIQKITEGYKVIQQKKIGDIDDFGDGNAAEKIIESLTDYVK